MTGMEGYDREFWQFSDQLRLQTAAFSGLSLGDSIWSPAGALAAAAAADRRNSQPDAAGLFAEEPAKNNGGGPGLIGSGKLAFGASKADRYNNLPTSKAAYNNNTTNDSGINSGYDSKNNNSSSSFAFNKMGSYGGYNSNTNNSGDVKSYFNKSAGRPASNNNNGHHAGGGKKHGGEYGKKKHAKNEGGSNNNSSNGTAADKRFKTLPASEALPRGEAVGGYIFVCNNDTMDENLRRELFGLPSRYRDSVRAIRPGLPLFLYNYSTHQLHGIFEAASFGGTNIDPTAWEDKKCPGESRFPAQVRVATRKIYDPLEEDAFRPILHHYDGPKFRLELSVTEALALLDIFADKDDA
ncbi:hypothetical protein HU200_036237 [Digitaria exilis]|uniref:DCD domain-containing protein n=1 Tax=Digitaria exilis TaxID=1010633 RepID=A0A835BFI9_9POAL|nr:hypothetical protein HU200_036237 [Digitaria exilis]CAB3477342.1 unnamed protein product [Digitaria exilis]